MNRISGVSGDDGSTHLLAFLDPTLDDFWCEFVCEHLFLVDGSPGRPAADNANVWAEQRILCFLIFIVGSRIGRSSVCVSHVDDDCARAIGVGIGLGHGSCGARGVNVCCERTSAIPLVILANWERQQLE